MPARRRRNSRSGRALLNLEIEFISSQLRRTLIVAAVGAISGRFADAQTTTDWMLDRVGNWNTSANWSAGVPTTLIQANILSGTAQVTTSTDGAFGIVLSGFSSDVPTVFVGAGTLNSTGGMVSVPANEFGNYIQTGGMATVNTFSAANFGTGTAGNLTVNISGGGVTDTVTAGAGEITNLTISGNGQLSMGGNLFVAQATIAGGTLSINSSHSLDTSASGNVTVSSGLLQLGDGFGGNVLDTSGTGLVTIPNHTINAIQVNQTDSSTISVGTGGGIDNSGGTYPQITVAGSAQLLAGTATTINARTGNGRETGQVQLIDAVYISD